MKITKFAALAGVALLAGAGAFAQATDDYNLPQGFNFYNEIGSDVVQVTGNAHKDYQDTNWRSEFAGIYDKIGITYTSEKLEFELAPKFGISDKKENYYDGDLDSPYYGHGRSFWGSRDTDEFKPVKVDGNGSLNSDDTGFSYWGLDWKLRFTPFDIVDFWLHGGPHIIGSYLPARGTEWGANYLGSDGFAIITKPIDGLRISGAIPFSADFSSKPNWLNAEVEDTWISKGDESKTREGVGAGGYRFRVDLGADYTLSSGLVGAGVKVEDIINAGYRKYGVYAGLNLGAITANLGYNYSENYTDFLNAFDDGLIQIRGKQAIAGGVTFVAGDLSLAADAMYNMNKKQSVYDVYAGLKAAYDLVPGKFNVDMLLGVAMDLGTNAHHGTDEDDLDLKAAAGSIKAEFIDLYYSHYALEDIRAAVGDPEHPNANTPNVGLGYVANKPDYNTGVAANQNWQYYTALSRTMANGNLDTTSAAKAALAVRIRPGFTYRTGKNEFQAHVNLVNFFDHDGSYQIKFPVSWKWSF